MITPVIELVTIECACCKAIVKTVEWVEYCLACMLSNRPSFEDGIRKLNNELENEYE